MEVCEIIMGSSEMDKDKPAKDKDKEPKTAPTSTQVCTCICIYAVNEFPSGKFLKVGSLICGFQEQTSTTSAPPGAVNPDWSGFQVVVIYPVTVDFFILFL